ncbi:S8/S53 family peptidase [Verrucosispora sp. WMMD1129]|uniref:S8/S53 family peptidase n=1 Tax=Verrucosispora sp. WMMD1129 TaxID=3016093 RepID=UPI00249C4514|nr:S8/S53 family peptidase [Verrucosispora sp. WMMD1129]WFE43478.1 S8/S53 family peptidase [Verrucosispora sp. WMMD1129]
MRPDRATLTGRPSRRRLLAASALAAAALPFGAGPRPSYARTRHDRADDEAYQLAFEAALTADPDVRRYLAAGRHFLYRPRQLLAATADAQRVAAWLRARGHAVTIADSFAGVTRLRFVAETDVPSIVTRLRDPRQWPGQPAPRVQPHHVLVGLGNIMGNPGTPPREAAALAPPDPSRLGEGAGVTVGICDTGIWRKAGDYHPSWLGGGYLPEPDDEDPLYLYADVLAVQGGHGTFVAGVVRQAAPGVHVDPEAALAPTGIGDEAMVVAAMGRLTPEVSVVNLSLGGFTLDDQPSMPLANAVAGLPPSTAVVAAAGNAGTDRPIWPAALDRVVGVAALASGPAGLVPAEDSGFGSWVDACAVGRRDSTYVAGRLPLPDRPTRVFQGFATWAGTSFAAAHVSGRLAALMTAGDLSADEARLALLAAPSWHPDYGVFVE